MPSAIEFAALFLGSRRVFFTPFVFTRDDFASASIHAVTDFILVNKRSSFVISVTHNHSYTTMPREYGTDEEEERKMKIKPMNKRNKTLRVDRTINQAMVLEPQIS